MQFLAHLNVQSLLIQREREREREREKDLSSTETKFQELSLQFTETVKKATTLIN
jgi:hypothetical protein